MPEEELAEIESYENTAEYQQSSINIIKESKLPPYCENFKMHKKFFIGNDKHVSNNATNILHFNKKHIFDIVSDDFLLPEERIVESPFFRKYTRYSITPECLYLDNVKLPLHDDGEYIKNNTAQIMRIQVADKIGECYIENEPLIPDGIYKIQNGAVIVPVHNYGNQPLQKPEKINHDLVLSTTLLKSGKVINISHIDHQNVTKKMSQNISQKYIKRSDQRFKFSIQLPPLGCTKKKTDASGQKNEEL